MVKSKSMKKNQKCKIGLLAFSLSFFVPFFANAIDQGAGKVTANVTQPSKRTIKGVVSDVSGEPLIGVSVLVKGTSIGASTNIDGVYSVEVPNNNAVLEFSYVGYQKATLSLANASSYDVVMHEETRVLQEVVVTAMGYKGLGKHRRGRFWHAGNQGFCLVPRRAPPAHPAARSDSPCG